MEGKTLRVPKLWILRSDAKSRVVVFMRLIVHLGRLPIQIDVTSVEVDRCIVRVLLQSHVKVLLGLRELAEVVVGQAFVVVMDS